MVYYAFGGRAPSAKLPADVPFYELCLDLGMAPDVVRQMNVRDVNKLKLVVEARKLALRQIAIKHKIPANYLIEL